MKHVKELFVFLLIIVFIVYTIHSSSSTSVSQTEFEANESAIENKNRESFPNDRKVKFNTVRRERYYDTHTGDIVGEQYGKT